jgi:hypothetical protein
LNREVGARDFATWEAAWDALIDAAVDFYHDNPVALSVLFGAEGAQEIRLADPEYDRRYAEWIAQKFGHLGVTPKALSVDHLRINVTATTALFSLSVWEHGRITPFYVDEIKRISKAYTEQLSRG